MSYSAKYESILVFLNHSHYFSTYLVPGTTKWAARRDGNDHDNNSNNNNTINATGTNSDNDNDDNTNTHKNNWLSWLRGRSYLPNPPQEWPRFDGVLRCQNDERPLATRLAALATAAESEETKN